MRSGSSGGRRAHVTLLQRLAEAGVEQPDELLDLAVLRLSRRLHPALCVADPEGHEHGVVLREQPVLGAVVVARDLDRLGARRRVEQRSALLRHAELVGGVGGVDVPVGEGLAQQRVDDGPGVLTERVVGGVRLGRVVRRHLQVASGLEVDHADLHAAHLTSLHHGCGSALPAAAGQGSHQGVGVEHGRPQAVPLRRRGLRGRSQDRGEDDDEDEGPQRHRDDESAVAWVHGPILGPRRQARRSACVTTSSTGTRPDSTSARSTQATSSVVPSTSTTRGSPSPTEAVKSRWMPW